MNVVKGAADGRDFLTYRSSRGGAFNVGLS
jgi:hypothetical protein